MAPELFDANGRTDGRHTWRILRKRLKLKRTNGEIQQNNAQILRKVLQYSWDISSYSSCFFGLQVEKMCE